MKMYRPLGVPADGRCPALGDGVDGAVSRRGLVRGWDNGVTGALGTGHPQQRRASLGATCQPWRHR